MVRKFLVKNSSSDGVWSFWTGTNAEWNAKVAGIEGRNVYQSAQWADHKASAGWQTLRLIFSASDSAKATITQCLVRSGPLKSFVVWVPGGPLGDLETIGKGFVKTLKQHLGASVIYIRVSITLQATSDLDTKLKLRKWKKAKNVIGASQSMIYSLKADQQTRVDNCSPNWKRNLRRSSKNINSPYLWETPNPHEISAAYELMDEYKKIEGLSLQRSVADLQSVISVFGSQLLLVRINDLNGDPLAIRGALIFENLAWDFIALTTPAGRKTYASYAVFWYLAEKCVEAGARQIDLSGIDPKNNKGVYDFKNGTGATQIDYQGEWETSSPSWFRPLASRLIARRVS
jgi:lipid II:glycine glycyltransferase (peptidoglycan interpeptide bridge formation enzyme)